MLRDPLLQNVTTPALCARCHEWADRVRLGVESWGTDEKGALDKMLDNPLLDYGEPGDLCDDCFFHIWSERHSIARRSLPRIWYW